MGFNSGFKGLIVVSWMRLLYHALSHFITLYHALSRFITLYHALSRCLSPITLYANNV